VYPLLISVNWKIDLVKKANILQDIAIILTFGGFSRLLMRNARDVCGNLLVDVDQVSN